MIRTMQLSTDGSHDSLDGEWSSRWTGGDAGNDWMTGKSNVKTIGDRVYILHEDESAYLIDLLRVGQDRLIGRYRSIANPTDTLPWVGKIVSPERIDGAWPYGRWDLRRTLSASE